MGTNIFLNKIFRSSAFVAAVLLVALFGLAAFPVASSISDVLAAPAPSDTVLTVTSENIILNLDAGANGIFNVSDPANLTVTTNNYTGYTLNIQAESNDADATKLVNGEYKFNSISAVSTSDDFNAGNWGIKPSKVNSVENLNFIPAPTYEGTVIEETNAANAVANSYTIALGAKADYSLPAGKYSNTFMIVAVGNPVGYAINYDAGTEETVNNMPDDESGELSENDVTVSALIPTRTGYIFVDWCNGSITNTNGVDSCDDVVYHPGDVFDTSMIIQNVLNLTAMWSLDTYTISYNLDGGSVATANPATYNYETNSFTLNNPTKTGHTFKGWSGTGLTGDENTDVTIAKGSSGNRSYTANWTVNSYRLDLNGVLDGTSTTNIGNFGTADVYINGELIADDVSDYCTEWPYGTTYEIKDIKAVTGKTYGGVSSGSLTGSIGAGNVLVFLKFDTNQYSVQVVVNNGTGAGTKTVAHGSSVQFTNVGPNSHYHYTSSSCTNGQSFTSSGTTITFSSVTNNTVCTINYSIDQFSAQLKVVNGTGAATVNNVNYNTAASFTNVKPSTGYGASSSISCTNNQSATISGTTVTTGGLTNNTVCTITFAANTYYIKYAGNGNTGGSMANTTCTYGSSCTLRNNAYSKTGWVFNGWSNGNASYANGASVSNLTSTNGATVTITAKWIDTTTPTISVVSGHKDYNDTSSLYSVSFGGSGGSVSCVNQSANNAAVTTIKSIGAIGRNTIKCTATGNNTGSTARSASATQTVYVDLSLNGNQMGYTTTCSSYTSGSNLVLKAQCSAGFDWQYGPYVTARAGTYSVGYNLGTSAIPSHDVVYNAGASNLQLFNEVASSGSFGYSFTVPSGGLTYLEFRIPNNTNSDIIIKNYRVTAQ